MFTGGLCRLATVELRDGMLRSREGIKRGWRGTQYLFGSRFNALIPLALLHIQVQGGYYVHTHQLWSNQTVD